MQLCLFITNFASQYLTNILSLLNNSKNATSQLRNFATSQLRNFATKKTKNLLPTLIAFMVLFMMSSCQKDINSPKIGDSANPQIVGDFHKKTDKNGNMVAYYQDNLPTNTPIPPCSPSYSTVDDLPIRAAGYSGCCCLNNLQIKQTNFGADKYLEARYITKSYSWNPTLFPTARYRKVVIVKSNGVIIFSDYLESGSGSSCVDNQSLFGLRFKPGDCPGHITFTMRNEYWIPSNNAWVYCAQADGEFDCI